MTKELELGQKVVILAGARGFAADYVGELVSVIDIDEFGCRARADDGLEMELFDVEFEAVQEMGAS